MNERITDYLLGELPERERASLEAQIAVDQELAAEIGRLRPVIERLHTLDDDAWDLPEAPSLAAPDPQTVSGRRPLLRWRRRSAARAFPAVALAAVMLGLGIAAGLLLAGDQDRETAGRSVALRPVEPGAGSGSGDITVSADQRAATVVVRGIAPTPGGEFYELWLLNSPSDLVSLGSFNVPASGDAEITVPLPADPSGFAAFDVSIEPADGNPAHSGRSVLRAPTSGS